MASFFKFKRSGEWKDYKNLRKHIKNPLQRTLLGYLAEPEAFDRMEASGVCCIPAWESSPVDLAVVGAEHRGMLSELSDGDRWRWLISQTDVPFLTVDVKYLGIREEPGRKSQPGRRYKFGMYDGSDQEAAVFLVVSAATEGFLGLVPAGVFTALKGCSDYAIDPLADQVPPWCHPYMVRDEDVPEAFRRMFEAAGTGSVYVNPTSGTPLGGWRPRVERGRAQMLMPVKTDTQMVSMRSILAFWEAVDALGNGVRLDFNPVKPFICDMLLLVPGVSEPLRIEFKHQTNLADTRAMRDRGPMHPDRQYHAVIVTTEAKDMYLCFCRHEADQVLAEGRSRLNQKYSARFLRRSVEEVMEHIARNAQQAIRRVDEVIAETSARGGAGIESLITSNHVGRVMDETEEAEREENEEEEEGEESDGGGEEEKGPAELGSNENHHMTLPWVCRRLNRISRDARSMVFFNLDLGHPVSELVAVSHHWTERDVREYDGEGGRAGTLPVKAIFAREARDLDCVPIRCRDHKAHVDSRFPDEMLALLAMSPMHWQKPASTQQFMILGSTQPVDVMEPNHHSPLYWLCPSEFTTQFAQGVRAPADRTGTQGEHCFPHDMARHVLVGTVPNKPLARTTPIRRGGVFMADGVDPHHFLFSLQEAHRHIGRVLDGGGGDTVSIGNAPRGEENKTFDRAKYMTKVWKMHRATWDLGVSRFVSKGKSVTAAREAERRGEEGRATEAQHGHEPQRQQ